MNRPKTIAPFVKAGASLMHDETIKPSRLRHKDIINQMDKWFKNGSTMFSSGQGVSMETLAFASLLMTILHNEVPEKKNPKARGGGKWKKKRKTSQAKNNF